MKKIFTFFMALVASVGMSAQISVTDGSIADWDNLPAEYVSKAVYQNTQYFQDGLKSMKVYATGEQLNLLLEINPMYASVEEWANLYIYFNADNSNETGGYGELWRDANCDISLVGSIGYGFYETSVQRYCCDAGDYWGCWCEESNYEHPSVQAIENHLIEIQIEYADLPANWNTEQFSIGVMMEQWGNRYHLPNAMDDEWGNQQTTDKLAVLVDPNVKSSRFEADGLWYKITNEEEATVEVIKEKGAEYTYDTLSNVVIPAEVEHDGKVYLVTSIGERAFEKCFLQSFTIPESVNYIHEYAFNLAVIVHGGIINNSQAYIYDWSYNSVDTIVGGMGINEHWVMHTKENIVEANIPEGVVGVGAYVFEGRGQLQVVNLPESLLQIHENAFAGCGNLVSITIPRGVEYIGPYAFNETPIIHNGQWENGMLYEDSCLLQASWEIYGDVEVAEGTRLIADRAFETREYLSGITIPSSVEHIGSEALYGCKMLASKLINHSQCTSENYWGATVYEEEVDGLYITNNIVVGANRNIREANIPQGVVGVAERALSSCYELQKVSMPNTLEWIKDYAFSDCDNLQSIKLPKSVKYIGNGAFAYCDRISEVVLSEGLDSIGMDAFFGCWNLYYITIPSTVRHIGRYAFCETNIQYVTFDGDVPPVMEYEVWGWDHYREMLWTVPCGALEAYQSLDIHNTYYNIYIENACIGGECGDALTWTYDEETHELAITGTGEMYDYVVWTPWYDYTSAISTIVLEEGMSYIGTDAFMGCKYVKSIAIPASVEKIGDSAFEGCRMLAELTFAEGSTLTEVGNWAFYNCHGLQTVVLPEGVTTVGEAAFYGCSHLKELVLPASMAYVAESGFGDCEGLKKMTVKAMVPPTVEARGFENVDRSIPVVVPAAAVGAYKAAPVWQEFDIQAKENVTTDVENIGATNGHSKMLRNGQLIIIRNGKEYNMLGTTL
jgi:hypothetical protein